MKRIYSVLLAMALVTGLTISVSQASMGNGFNGSGGIGGTGVMGTIMMPTGQAMFRYGMISDPISGTGASTTMPIGVGSVATGGNMLSIHTAMGQFYNPMDIYFALYAPSVSSELYLLHQDGSLQPASNGISAWMSSVMSVDQFPFGAISTSSLPKGTYTLYMMATPAGSNMANYYMWSTQFVIQ